MLADCEKKRRGEEITSLRVVWRPRIGEEKVKMFCQNLILNFQAGVARLESVLEPRAP